MGFIEHTLGTCCKELIELRKENKLDRSIKEVTQNFNSYNLENPLNAFKENCHINAAVSTIRLRVKI